MASVGSFVGSEGKGREEKGRQGKLDIGVEKGADGRRGREVCRASEEQEFQCCEGVGRYLHRRIKSTKEGRLQTLYTCPSSHRQDQDTYHIAELTSRAFLSQNPKPRLPIRAHPQKSSPIP